MAYVISVISNKGGVGKTTTALALGDCLLAKGKRVLFIDLDYQRNLSISKNILNESGGSYFVLQNPSEIKMERILLGENGDVIHATMDLILADKINGQNLDIRIKEAVKSVSDLYDYIIIDTPPALNILTINAIMASNGIIVTAQADGYSVQGLSTLKTVLDQIGTKINILGILFTRYNPRTLLTQHITTLLENQVKTLNTSLFNTKIRECNAIKESQINAVSLWKYAKNSNAVADYESLLNEILERI